MRSRASMRLALAAGILTSGICVGQTRNESRVRSFIALHKSSRDLQGTPEHVLAQPTVNDPDLASVSLVREGQRAAGSRIRLVLPDRESASRLRVWEKDAGGGLRLLLDAETTEKQWAP